MKNYLLTVIANVHSEKMVKDMALSITPIVDSANLKFQFSSKGIILFYFSSEVYKEDLFEYINGIMFGLTESFILTEINDKVSVSLPTDVKNHLFNLDEVGDDVKMNLDMNDVKMNFGMDEDIDEDDMVALILNGTNTKVKKPTLDSILDKINTKGYESLSQYEKDTLESYSKN